MHPNVVSAIKKSAAVPSMPQVVTRFMEVIQDPNFNYNSVVKVLSVDAGTVSEILRLANSALFGISRKVTSLKQALTLLGPRRTRSLVLGRFLVETVGSDRPCAVDTSYFWRRSLVSAVVGARIGDKLCPRLRDEVFLCALLADVGITILAEAFPTEYSQIAADYTPYGQPIDTQRERDAVGTTHSEVSAMVLTDWSLPEEMCNAVRMSHDDVPVTDDATQIARVLNGSDRIAKMLCEIPDVNNCLDTCAQAMAFVGVELSVLAQILNDVESDVEELASILKIDVIPSVVYSKIAEAVKERLAVSSAAP